MGKQIFGRMKKTVAILLAVFFVVSVTAASASACSSKTATSAGTGEVGYKQEKAAQAQVIRK
ncbi:MAG TPA: hypothetical protein VGK06_14820 [Methanosarcina sp.]